MKKVLIIFLILAFTAFLVSLTVFPIEDADIWFHLKAGDWLWQNQKLPCPDPFSWPIKDLCWQDHEWGIQLLLYGLKNITGFYGLIIVKTIIIAATFLLLFLVETKLNGFSFWAIFFLTIGILASAERFIIRVEHVGYLFLVLFLSFIWLWKKRLLHLSKKKTANLAKYDKLLPLLILPVLFLFWSNLHPSSALAMVLLVLLLFGESFMLAKKYWKYLLLSAVLAITFGFITPYGPKPILDVFKVGQNSYNLYEWQSPFSSIHQGMPYVVFFKILFFSYWTAFFVGVWRGKSTLSGFLFLSLVSYLGMTSARNINVFVLVGFLPAMEGLRGIRLKLPVKWQYLFLFLLSIGFMTASVFVYKDGYRLGTTYRRFALGVKRIIPEEAVAFLDVNHISGNLLNQYEIGGYLIYSGRKVFIDGRAHYPDWFIQKYRSMGDSAEITEEILDQYQIDYAVVLYPETETGKSVPDYLSVNPQWSLVYWDDYYLVFVKRSEKNLPLIEKYGYDYGDPMRLTRVDFVKRLESSEGSLLITRITAELERTISQNPKNSKAHLYLGNMLERQGLLADAFKEYKRAISVNPDDPLAYLLLAGILVKKEDFAQVKSVLSQVLKINSNLPTPYLILGQIEQKEGRFKKALKLYQKALVRGPEIGATHFNIGVIYSSAIYNRAKAKQHLLQAIELGLSDSDMQRAKELLQTL